MIETKSTISSSKTTRKRTSERVKKVVKKNGELSNGSRLTSTPFAENESELDKSWNVMDYSDYLQYRKNKAGAASLDSSKLANSSSSQSSLQEDEDGPEAPGFIFRYYKKFGFYWNVFPKTDYCYLPGSPDYHKEVSPGIPKVPNLSRYPLNSYLRRGVNAGVFEEKDVREAESRLAFSDSSLLSSTKVNEEDTLRLRSGREAEERSQLHSANSNSTTYAGHRTALSRLHGRGYRLRRQADERWSITRVSRSVVTFVTRTVRTSVTTVTNTFTTLLGISEASQEPPSPSRSSYLSCLLPLFLFLLFLIPLACYLFPGLVESRQEEVVTAVSRPAGHFFSFLTYHFYSALNLVTEAFLYIPVLYSQLFSLFAVNSTNLSKFQSETTTPCRELPDEKLAALQTEMLDLKKDLAGQNHHLLHWIDQIEKQLTHFSDEMKKLNSQLEGDQKEHFAKLEGELTDLRRAMVEMIEKERGPGSGAVGLGTSGYELTEKMVELAVAKYHADRTGKPDYALQSAGGTVVRVRCAQTYTRTTGKIYILGLPLPWDVSNGPETIIKPGTMPGECWAFEGSFAQITLKLAARVRVTAFTLEHSPKELAPLGHISSAPRDFSVWALGYQDDPDPAFLGRFTFLDNGESLQQFDALVYDEPVELIELKIESNHGHPDYTCLYRFRVHGIPSTYFEGDIDNTTHLVAGKASPKPSVKSSKPY